MAYKDTWIGSLPKWGQIIFYLVVAYILYKIYKYFKDKANEKNFVVAVNESQHTLTQLANQGVKPSYPQSDYANMANTLEQTFIGCGIGWSDVVVPTFQKIKNDADIYALIVAYGVRTIDECGWGSFAGDLSATLSYKLGGIILTIANPSDFFTDASVKSVNKILSNNGVKFQF